MAKAMKKAMKKAEQKQKKEESETEEEEESGSDEEKAEESSSEEGDEKGDESTSEEEEAKPKSIVQEANAAKSNVNRCQRIITRLEGKQKDLAKKMKENKDALRKVEKEMEEFKEVLSKKKRIVNKKNNEKLAAIEERKAVKASRIRKMTNKRLKAAQKRLDAVSNRMRGVKGKAEDAKAVLKRAQSKYDECAQTCKSLKAKGERVPEDFKDDFSSPHAWKPPGYVAAKALAQAKEVLKRAQDVFSKVNGEFESKDMKRKASQDAVEEVKKKRKGDAGAKSEELAKVATPTRSLAGKKARKGGR